MIVFALIACAAFANTAVAWQHQHCSPGDVQKVEEIFNAELQELGEQVRRRITDADRPCFEQLFARCAMRHARDLEAHGGVLEESGRAAEFSTLRRFGMSFVRPAKESEASLLADIDGRYVRENIRGQCAPFRSLRVEPDDIVVDAGAFRCFFTLKLARMVGPAGHIVAIEPLSENVKVCKEHLRLNRFTNRVSVLHAAISDKKGRGTLLGRFANARQQNSLLQKLPSGGRPFGEKLEDVDFVSVDSLVADLALPRVDHIFLEVNGVEVDAVRGAENTIKRFHPTVIAANRYANGGKDLENLLRSLGYQHFESIDGELTATTTA